MVVVESFDVEKLEVVVVASTNVEELEFAVLAFVDAENLEVVVVTSVDAERLEIVTPTLKAEYGRVVEEVIAASEKTRDEVSQHCAEEVL